MQNSHKTIVCGYKLIDIRGLSSYVRGKHCEYIIINWRCAFMATFSHLSGERLENLTKCLEGKWRH